MGNKEEQHSMFFCFLCIRPGPFLPCFVRLPVHSPRPIPALFCEQVLPSVGHPSVPSEHALELDTMGQRFPLQSPRLHECKAPARWLHVRPSTLCHCDPVIATSA
jgi:hypothetical protein